MTQNDSEFTYMYSASQQDEIMRIRKKYAIYEEDRLVQLKRLDRSVSLPGIIVSIIVGTAGALVFGTGLSCVLVWPDLWFTAGIVTGVAGIIMMILAYPLYSIITKKRRQKLGPVILSLTEELLK